MVIGRFRFSRLDVSRDRVEDLSRELLRHSFSDGTTLHQHGLVLQVDRHVPAVALETVRRTVDVNCLAGR